MNTLVFRRAVPADRAAVLALYKSCVGGRYCTWDEFYPSAETIEEDLTAGTLFLLTEDDRIIGAVSVTAENELDTLPFWHSADVAGELSRLCITPVRQGQGLSRILVENIEAELLRRGCTVSRLLAAKKNLPALALYRRMGYTAARECHMYDNDYFAMEKEL